MNQTKSMCVMFMFVIDYHPPIWLNNRFPLNFIATQWNPNRKEKKKHCFAIPFSVFYRQKSDSFVLILFLFSRFFTLFFFIFVYSSFSYDFLSSLHTVHSFIPKSTAVIGGNLSHILYVISMKKKKRYYYWNEKEKKKLSTTDYDEDTHTQSVHSVWNCCLYIVTIARSLVRSRQ